MYLERFDRNHMHTSVYYTLNAEKGVAEGPHTLAELAVLRGNGQLTPESWIAKPGDNHWERIADKALLLEKLFPNHPLVKVDQPPENTVDIRDILGVNLSREDPNTLIPALRKDHALKFKGISRNLRDYLLLIIFGNGLLTGLTLSVAINPMTLASCIGFFVLSSCGLAYVLFFVMDRY